MSSDGRCDICGTPAVSVQEVYLCESHGTTTSMTSSDLYFGKTSHGKIHVALTPTETACARTLKIPMENLGDRVESNLTYWHESMVCIDCRRKLDLFLYQPTPYYSLKGVTL